MKIRAKSITKLIKGINHSIMDYDIDHKPMHNHENTNTKQKSPKSRSPKSPREKTFSKWSPKSVLRKRLSSGSPSEDEKRVPDMHPDYPPTLTPTDGVVKDENNNSTKTARRRASRNPTTQPAQPAQPAQPGEEVCCSGHDHLPYNSLNEVFNLPVDKVFEYVFSDCPFNAKFNTARRAPDCKLPPWPQENDSDGNKTRNVVYDVTVTYSLGTKTSSTNEKQTLYGKSKPGHIYMIDTQVSNSGIPYTETFLIANRVCITRVTNHSSRLRVSSEIRYKKHVWGVVKSFIEKNTYNGLTEHYRLLADSLRAEEPSTFTKGASMRGSKVVRGRRCVGKPGAGPSPISENGSRKEKPSAPPVPTDTRAPAVSSTHRSAVDTLVTVIYAILVILVLFNAVLFYKLWSLEDKAHTLAEYQDAILPDYSETPTSDSAWVSLLEKQHRHHKLEIHKWKSIIQSTVHAVRQIESTLEDLDRAVKTRSDDFLDNIRFAEEHMPEDDGSASIVVAKQHDDAVADVATPGNQQRHTAATQR